MQDINTLIANAQKGDVEAYGILVKQYQDLAVGYAFSVLRDFHLAEDVAQEAFVAGFDALPQLRDAHAFSGWFRRVVFKYCDRAKRRKQALNTLPEVLDQAVSQAPTPDVLAEKAQLRERVRQAIQRLPEGEREAVALFYLSGYSQQEVGRFLDVTVSTVKNRLRSARRRLQDDLMDLIDGLHQVRPSRDEKFKEKTMHAIVDPNLEQAVRETVGKPTGELNVSDLDKIKELDIRDREIANLEGLEALSTLQQFVATFNLIEDVSALSDLTSLEKLVLPDNRIADLSPIRGLVKLKELALFYNQIRDLTFLSNFKSLEILDLYSNQIQDLNPLVNLIELKEIDLQKSQIVDLSPLAGLINLEVLSLRHNAIEDLSPLSELRSLKRLSVKFNRVVDLEPLKDIETLTHLDVSNVSRLGVPPSEYANRVSDLSPLAQLTNLVSLSVNGNPISDLSPLIGLNALANLNASHCEIEVLDVLSGLGKLTTLNLSHNRIVNVSELARLVELTRLELDENSVEDIAPLDVLAHLTDLSLAGNRIETVNVLSGMPGIQTLNVSNNQIGDISALRHCTQLKRLSVEKNKVIDIACLTGLAHLEEINLRGNQISDLSVLVSNGALGEGCRIDVRDNPLDDTDQIRVLEARGVVVLYDGYDFSPVIAESDDEGMMVIPGVVQEIHPNDLFEVVLANGECGKWFTSEKMRLFRVALGLGDRVSVRFPPDAPNKGRIVYRYLRSFIED